jgi:hypothetical protein
MKTQSFTFGSPDEIKAQIDIFKNNGFDPEIAFAFVTPRKGIEEFSAAFSGSGINVVGASTGGNILTGEGDKNIYEDKAVVTFVEMNASNYAYLCVDMGEDSSYDFGTKLGKWGSENFTSPSFIVIASGLSINGEELVEGILETAGVHVSMFGGLAGDETKFEQNFVFSGEKVLGNGAIALVFDQENVEVKGIATSGWVGLGKDLRITSSESNVVYSIDNQPALTVYKNYLNVQDSDLPAIGVEYPLLIKREDNSYALRAVMGVDRENESLIFAGTVPQDAIVTFSSSPGFEVIDRTKEKVRNFIKRNKNADMMLLFSCMARHLALGPTISDEIAFPAEKMGMQLSGFFTYGEIGTNPGHICDFFNQTYTLVFLREK